MLRRNLTDLAVRKLGVSAKDRFEVFDARIPGFAVRVSPSGVKSFVLMYRVDGRLRRMTLGRYPILSLIEARKLATEALNKVARGGDPEAPTRTRATPYAFNRVVPTFIETHAARLTRGSTREQSERVLAKRFAAVWDAKDVRAISKQDVIEILDSIVEEGTPSAANNALAVIRKFFNWCVERNLLDHSPCEGITRPAKTASRVRVLSDDEISAVWMGADRLGYPFGRIVQLLLLTAQRRSEVASLRWAHLNRTTALWTLPAEITKNNREHVVPLSGRAVAIIEGIPAVNEVFVFPSQGQDGRSFSGFGKSKHRLDAVSGVTGWTLHDLRRTAATGMARLEVQPHVIERVLNHVSGSLGGVAGVYNRFQYLPQVKEALELWADHISSLASGSRRSTRSRFVD